MDELERGSFKLTSGVAGSVGGTRLTADGGEPHRDRSLGADLLEERRARQILDVMGDLEIPMGTRALGMNDALCTSAS